MLQFLAIRNVAVIERLDLEFEPGLNILSGETGAGKSILVEAVGLLLGGRASAEFIRTGEEQASVEAAFEDAGGREVIVRRDLSAQSGRSRAFLDGALTTSTVLREVVGSLIELHGQHEHQVLLDSRAHLDLLDAFAGLDNERTRVKTAFDAWQRLRIERDRIHAGARDALRRREFLEFQLDEIRRIAPKPAEDEELTQVRTVLVNADRIQRLCAEAYASLYEGDHAALGSLAFVWKKISELAAIDPQFEPFLGTRVAIKSQLEDLAYFLRSYSSVIEESPRSLQGVEDRLVALERLKKKHGPTLSDVMTTAEQMTEELSALGRADARAAGIDAELNAARAEYAREAGVLSVKRHAAALDFSSRLQRSLKDLAMPQTRCEVRFLPERGEEAWTDRGRDEGEFFLSPNPGEDLRPLARIASGGELSRIMLALKTLVSADAPGKTLIFDEVDAGIGGAVGDSVGAHLRCLGERFQVLCITHLPQIAAYGTTHFRIAKSVKAERTVTEVRRLSARDREDELARMIGGAQVSSSIRASAREMLRNKGANSPLRVERK